MAVLFIPIIFGIVDSSILGDKRLGTGRGQHLADIGHRSYLNLNYLHDHGLCPRIVYFAIWILHCVPAEHMVDGAGRSARQKPVARVVPRGARARADSLCFTISFAVIDWVMSLRRAGFPPSTGSFSSPAKCCPRCASR